MDSAAQEKWQNPAFGRLSLTSCSSLPRLFPPSAKGTHVRPRPGPPAGPTRERCQHPQGRRSFPGRASGTSGCSLQPSASRQAGQGSCPCRTISTQPHAGVEGTSGPHRFGFQSWFCHFLSCVALSKCLCHSDPQCQHLENEENHTR